jgi:hypothetical protein
MTPSGLCWQACNHAVAIGGQSFAELRQPWYRKSVTQPTDRTITRAVTVATICSRCCLWRINESTATIAAAPMRKMGSVVYREPGSPVSMTLDVVTHDDRPAPNAVNRRPVIRDATTNTRAGPRCVIRAARNTTARIPPMISVAPSRPAND